jgi:hypothetical protein
VLRKIDDEKVVEIDQLRRMMLIAVRGVKQSMLNQSEDSFVGTTRLTMQQNSGLTGELEY